MYESLPASQLCNFPTFQLNFKDFLEASQTCTKIYNIFQTAPPNTILRLAVASSLPIFHPRPLPLIIATARQISDWVFGISNGSNTQDLREALKGGLDGLYTEYASITFDGIRRLHRAKYAIIKSLSDIIHASLIRTTKREGGRINPSHFSPFNPSLSVVEHISLVTRIRRKSFRHKNRYE
ncbi:hypothetical protein Moror_14161 [Moniliophthora roreri MCA 2997]|uniref:Uncharacterized protein n=1 Tax=Moniliophthora roreri (strain MCA 2997) TaxID=1381753 RepID=V2X6I8_MONRO|nr:hypothetical protein Moror_14161 [Moniliophthora roreri MCA 2997]